MPELAKPWLLLGVIRNWQCSSKWPGSPLVQIRNVFILRGSWAVVWPTIAPSFADHSFGLPLQPVISLPLKISSPSLAASLLCAPTASIATAATIAEEYFQLGPLFTAKLICFIMSLAKICGLSPQFHSWSARCAAKSLPPALLL